MLDSLIQGDAASMFIVLPDDLEGIKNLESEENFAAVTSNFTDVKPTEIELTLPKFKVETTLDLKSNLIQVRQETRLLSNTAIQLLVHIKVKVPLFSTFFSRKVHSTSITIYPLLVF
jgi:Serine protease inhibitor